MIALGGIGAARAAVASPIDRDTAREAAQRELSKRIYHADDPGLLQRMLNAAADWLDRVLTRAAHATPGGFWGLLALLAIVGAAVALILWRGGPPRRIGSRPGADAHLSGLVTADEHRRRADAFAVDARFAEAVRERLRAIVRDLEDRGVLDPRPGRTADEVAREAGAAVPVIAGALRAAATLFDEIWYGGRPATAGSDAAMREADQRVRGTQLAVVSGGGTAAGYEAPR